ncbi:MAG: hypothetical protein ACUZ8I_14290 [Candidatus Scalindua sp.]
MGQASRRGTYKERKTIAIKKRQDEWVAEGVRERDRIIAMTPEERREKRKIRNTLMMYSQWLPKQHY